MGINELFDGIAKVVERFAEEIAEQKLLEKKQKTGRDPKVKPEKTENESGKEKEIYRDFPKTG
jgi:hypothetical protein